MEDELEQAQESFSSLPWVGQVVTAAIIIAVTAAAVHVVVKLLRRWLNNSANPLPNSSIFINIIRAIFWICGIGVLLRVCFDLDVNAIIAGLGVFGIAVSLGLQNTISNLIGGLQISVSRLVEPGHRMRIGTTSGTVRDVNWRYTMIETQSNTFVAIPNSCVNTGEVEDLTTDQLVIVPITIPLAAYSEKLTERIVQATEDAVGIYGDKDKPPKLKLTGSSLDGLNLNANIYATTHWQEVDSTFTNMVLRAIVPILQEARGNVFAAEDAPELPEGAAANARSLTAGGESLR